jgi:hypothetical protein
LYLFYRYHILHKVTAHIIKRELHLTRLSGLSLEDQQQIQKNLQLRQQCESDQQVSKSNTPSKKYTKKRQSGLTEFIE